MELNLQENNISNSGFGIMLENIELLNECEILVDARNNIIGGAGLNNYD